MKVNTVLHELLKTSQSSQKKEMNILFIKERLASCGIILSPTTIMNHLHMLVMDNSLNIYPLIDKDGNLTGFKYECVDKPKQQQKEKKKEEKKEEKEERTKEEKEERREERKKEKKISLNPDLGIMPFGYLSTEAYSLHTSEVNYSQSLEAFEKFWNSYPVQANREGCIHEWQLQKLDPIIEEILTDITTKKKHDKRWKDGFFPFPFRYLREKRWQDKGFSSKTKSAIIPTFIVDWKLQDIKDLQALVKAHTDHIAATQLRYGKISDGDQQVLQALERQLLQAKENYKSH